MKSLLLDCRSIVQIHIVCYVWSDNTYHSLMGAAFLFRIWLVMVLIPIAFFSAASSSSIPDPNIWTEGYPVPDKGRSNPYDLSQEEWPKWIRQGRLHALNYPVEVTGLQIPAETLQRIFEPSLRHPLLSLVGFLLGSTKNFKSQDDLESWLGLSPYPQSEGEGPYFVPFLGRERPDVRMGSSTLTSALGTSRTGITYSCAACHVSQFFGRPVVGLTTRFPRANEFFLAGRQLAAGIPPGWIGSHLGIPEDDVTLAKQLATRARSVDGVLPLQLGLDTSLAHVALSLSRRADDDYASFDRDLERRPRENVLRTFRADSKPSVWWNVKYKNRWLSDGSVVSGNPIFTNILWNEIGRGTDLKELETWLDDNSQVVQELTAAVFASEPPRWMDFFPLETLDAQAARRGAATYQRSCASCHGHVEKAWERAEFAGRDLNGLNAELFQQAISTTDFRYFDQTPVVDVGTDPLRAQGMRGLLVLNELEISKRFSTVIRVSNGYVPPPLLGLFARYPYFHNNSVPNLCELLTPAPLRVKKYIARPSIDPERDFDPVCVGYPLPKPSESDQTERSELIFDTHRAGMSARGHDEGIFMENGVSLISEAEKRELIEFLKTL